VYFTQMAGAVLVKLTLSNCLNTQLSKQR